MLKSATQKIIAFTGGGSSGHVNPNIPLVHAFKHDGWRVIYIGSKDGPEREICLHNDVREFYSITTERLRRYRALSNLTIPFKVLAGLWQAIIILHKTKPALLFSKGGFVSVPVVIAAAILGIPVVSHESDLSPGLATQINKHFSFRILLTFPKSFYDGDWTKSEQFITSGIPVREAFRQASPQKLNSLIHRTSKKPIFLVFGGSSGAKIINSTIRSAIDQLTSLFEVIHIVGKGNIDTDFIGKRDYHQIEYLHSGMEHLIAASEVILCRAGMTSLIELLFLKQPAILVPLTARVSRGDQLQNAATMEKHGCHLRLSEEDLSTLSLLTTIRRYESEKPRMIQAISNLRINFSPDSIKLQILQCTKPATSIATQKT